MGKITNMSEYLLLMDKIGNTITNARENSYKAINKELIQSYWEIGKYIVEFEQEGSLKAEYGANLLLQISKDLKIRYGKGFSKSNVFMMRLLYVKYAQNNLLSEKLSWSHYYELLKIEDDLERSFYEKQSIKENWSVRELRRQKETSLFLRLATSKDKDRILELAKNGQIIEKGEDIIKPHVLEFLNLPEDHSYTESDLEQSLIDNLQKFLLELGKGFAFIGRQYRITLNGRHFYVDLVFYHTKLKCYVLIDLKLPDVKHHDIGQMNMYLGYFAKEENETDDNPPIGILLTREKDEVMIEYAMYNVDSNLFVTKYQLYLPNRDELKQRVEKILNK